MDLFDLAPRRRLTTTATQVEHVEPHRPLRKVLAFTRRSIDDVVNCPVAKAEVLGYYKLQRWVQRRSEAVDLDRWWSGQDTRPRRSAATG